MTLTQSALTAAFWGWLAPRAHRLPELADGETPFTPAAGRAGVPAGTRALTGPKQPGWHNG